MRDVDDTVLTTEEASQLLKVNSKTLLSMARLGALPGAKVGRSWQFLQSDLLAFVSGETAGRS
ncbi:helix-turn-helix domain-containing protein [Microbacterium sp.]|uniref:helix-turn-helix domain-containing protein n=1 Tax=Microbacterium sp. TaxID=51671 RepID=UPI003A935C76